MQSVRRSSATTAQRAYDQRRVLLAGLALVGAVAATMLPETGHALTVPSTDEVLQAADAQDRVDFVLTLPLHHQTELNKLQEALYTPGGPDFHRFLTPDEFRQRFAPSQAEYDALKAAAQQLGLSVRGDQPSRTFLEVSAPAAIVSRQFGTTMEWHQTSDGRRYLAPRLAAGIPQVLSALKAGVAGLNGHPLSTHLRGLRPASAPNAGTGGNGSFAPADIRSAYNVDGIQNGGQTVAIYELSSANYSDAGTYASRFGLNNPTITQVNVSGGTADKSGSTEVMLDIEMVMAIANPTGMIIYTGPNSYSGALATYQKIADDALANQVSVSWGLPEQYQAGGGAQAEAAIFTQMVTEGIAVFVAAGDSGANDNGSSLSVDDPASQPNVTSVGGTNLQTDILQNYTSESVWHTNSSEGGGGGISTIWSMPSYQQGIVSGASASQFSTSMRNVPDVALNADPASGYLIYDSNSGGWGVVGGTSAAAPLWAGFWSLVNNGVAAAGGSSSRAGFANPLLYSIGTSSRYANDFHDVQSGNNAYYNAIAGFDDATGWGSFNAGNLYTDLVAAASQGSVPPPPAPKSAPTSVKITAGTASDKTGQLAITWGSVAGATQYLVFMGTAKGQESGTPVATVSGNAATITGLAFSTSYYIKVAAANSGGTGPSSSEASAKTPPPPPKPAAPTGLAATTSVVNGSGDIVLTWKASSGATSYNVYMGTAAGKENGTAVTTVTGTSAEIGSLNLATTYYFKVSAINGNGEGALSSELKFSTPSAPAAPAGLSAKTSVVSGSPQIILTWTAPGGPAASLATSYNIYMGTSANGESSTAIATVSGTTCTLSGLSFGTTYYFKVAGVNAVGQGVLSSEKSIATTPAPPDAVGDLSATSASGSVNLAWSGTARATAYSIYMGTSAGGEGATPVATVNSTAKTVKVTVGKLTKGMTYYFTVIASDAAGKASSSNEASAAAN